MRVAVVRYVEFPEDEVRFQRCLASVPAGWPVEVVQASPRGKAYHVNAFLETLPAGEPVLVLDGDIVLPQDLARSEPELLEGLRAFDAVFLDQVGDRRHPPNVPTHGPITAWAPLAGGAVCMWSHLRFPDLGPGYQPEDALFCATHRTGICPAVKVLHPWPETEELRNRTRARHGPRAAVAPVTPGRGSAR